MRIWKYLPIVSATIVDELPETIRFPKVGVSIIPVGLKRFNLVQFLDFGSSTRVFLARAVPSWTAIPDEQSYRIPSEAGITAEGFELPNDVVIKFISSTSTRLLHSIENEFQVYLKLNAVNSVRKPIGFYLSPRWRCDTRSSYECQYIVMTQSSRDIERLIGKNFFKLQPPVLDGLLVPKIHNGIYSFEAFVAAFMINLADEITKFHEAGFAHGDVRSCNVAVDLETYEHVFLIDVGASFVLSELADDSERKRRIDHDIGQLPVFLQKLVKTRVWKVYGDKNLITLSPLYRLGVELQNRPSELRETLNQYLLERGVRYGGKFVRATSEVL